MVSVPRRSAPLVDADDDYADAGNDTTRWNQCNGHDFVVARPAYSTF